MAKQNDYNALLKYDPELNTIPFRKFNSVEMDLLFAVLTQVKDKGNSLVVLPFERLKNISSYSPTANKRFVADVYSVADKLLSLRFGRTSKSGLTIERFVLFTKFAVIAENTDKPRLEVQVFDEAIPLLNDLTRWVRFNYSDFVKLKSTYAKTMFRLLKQYRTTGLAVYKIDDFYELLSIPKSYRYNQANLDARVLKPIKTELSPLFRGLTVRKIHSSKRGHPIKEIQFIFKPEHKKSEDIKRNPDFMLHNQTFNLIHNLDLSSEERRKQVIKLFSDFNEDYLELERKGALPEWAKLEDSNSDYIQYGHDDNEVITDFENVDFEKFVTNFEKSQSIDVETFNVTADHHNKNVQKIREENEEALEQSLDNVIVKVYDKWVDLFGVDNAEDSKQIVKSLINFAKRYDGETVLEVLSSIKPDTAITKKNFDANARLSYLNSRLLLAVRKK